LQRRTEVSFTDLDETEMGNSDLEVETRVRKKGRVKRSRQQELKQKERQKLTSVDIDKQYLDCLKEIGKRMGEIFSDSDRMFLINLLPAMKQLSPLDNLDFRVKVQETLLQKPRRLAAREI
jgi:hypothetical protein